MAIVLNDNLKVNAPKPIDTRIVKSSISERDLIPLTERYSGLQVRVLSNFLNYTWDGSSWIVDITNGSSVGGDLSGTLPNPSVVWVNGYSTYDLRYPRFSGSYANPSWITSLSWSKIFGTPTTLSGYGITDAINVNQIAVANGVASLDSSGKIPLNQLPSTLLIYKGVWNASTNTPTLSNGTSTPGYTYRVTGSGTVDFGDGPITFASGDYVIYNDQEKWEKCDNTDIVTSVNGYQGVVVLNTDDVAQGSTNLYYANSLVQSYLNGAISPILTTNLTANRAIVSNSSGKIIISSVTSTELGYLSGVTSNLQTQIDSKQNNLIFGNLSGSEFDFTGATNSVIGTGTSISLKVQTGVVGTVGSITAIPVLTINDKGLITGVSTAAIDIPDKFYNLNSPATRAVGGVIPGDTLTGLTSFQILEKVLCPYTAPTITLLGLTPSNSEFNAQNITYNVRFQWFQNIGTGPFVSGQIQYKRSNIVTWTNLTTNITGSGNTRQADGSITLNTSGVNNNGVDFRVTFVDSQSNTSIVYTSTFSSYALPTANLNLNVTPSLVSGVLIRSLSTTYSNTITGTITRNSVNVDLSQYKIQRDYNDSTWIDLNSLTSIGAAGGSISSLNDTTQPNNKNSIRYRAFIIDGENTSGVAISNQSQFNIVQPVYFGMSSETSIANVDLSTLAVVNRTYNNNSNDRFINGLSYSANNNRFCYAYDDSYGVINGFIHVENSNQNLLVNFITGTKSVTFADGTTKTYRIYLYNLVVSPSIYTINIT